MCLLTFTRKMSFFCALFVILNKLEGKFILESNSETKSWLFVIRWNWKIVWKFIILTRFVLRTLFKTCNVGFTSLLFSSKQTKHSFEVLANVIFSCTCWRCKAKKASETRSKNKYSHQSKAWRERRCYYCCSNWCVRSFFYFESFAFLFVVYC